MISNAHCAETIINQSPSSKGVPFCFRFLEEAWSACYIGVFLQNKLVRVVES